MKIGEKGRRAQREGCKDSKEDLKLTAENKYGHMTSVSKEQGFYKRSKDVGGKKDTNCTHIQT